MAVPPHIQSISWIEARSPEQPHAAEIAQYPHGHDTPALTPMLPADQPVASAQVYAQSMRDHVAQLLARAQQNQARLAPRRQASPAAEWTSPASSSPALSQHQRPASYPHAHESAYRPAWQAHAGPSIAFPTSPITPRAPHIPTAPTQSSQPEPARSSTGGLDALGRRAVQSSVAQWPERQPALYRAPMRASPSVRPIIPSQAPTPSAGATSTASTTAVSTTAWSRYLTLAPATTEHVLSQEHPQQSRQQRRMQSTTCVVQQQVHGTIFAQQAQSTPAPTPTRNADTAWSPIRPMEAIENASVRLQYLEQALAALQAYHEHRAADVMGPPPLR